MGTLSAVEEQALIDRALGLFEESQRQRNAQGDHDLMVQMAQRILALEKGVPKNAFRLKPKDGHHHMEPARLLEDGTDKGFGFELDFKNSTVVRGSNLENRKFTITPAGGLGFCYDYLVDNGYTGTEGATVTLPNTTTTFKTYSTIKAAVDDANSNRQASGQTSYFYICPGVHVVAATINLAAPSTGGYHFVGSSSGLGNIRTDTGTRLDGSGTTNIFTTDAPSSGANYVFENLQLEVDSGSISAGIVLNHSVGIRVANCSFLLGNSGSSGIFVETGDETENIIKGCYFQGTGNGIRFQATAATANEWIISDCWFTCTVGIAGNTGLDVRVSTCFFQGSGLTGITIGATDPAAASRWSITSCMFDELAAGIDIRGTTTSTESILISGNAFEQCAVGVECATAAGPAQRGINIDSNQFFTATGSQIAVRGDATLTTQSRCCNNTFNGYDSGNEIVDWTGSGNEACHNLAFDGATKEALADIGTPVGHVNAADDIPDHTHEDSSEGGTVDHGNLANVTADQHHAKYTDAEAIAAAPAEASASETAEGVVERATVTEVNAGTDTTRYIAPDELAGSIFGVKGFQIQVFPTGTTQTTGNKKTINHIFPEMDGMELFYAHAEQTTPGEVGSLLTIDINKNGTSMLATLLTCDVGESGSDTALNPVAFKTDGTEIVATNDVTSIDIDGLHDTEGIGLIVTYLFRIP